MKKVDFALVVLLFLWFFVSIPSPSAAGKGEKEAIEKLTSEVLILQRQVRDIQESIGRSSGQLIALVNQIGDNVARASHAIANIRLLLGPTG